jgi:hypothetical protein
MRLKSNLVNSIFLTAVFVLSWGVALAQSPNTGSLVVTVVDQNDAVIQNAAVTVANVSTGSARQGNAGEGGSATFAGLPVNGEYALTVEMAGFTRHYSTGINLRAGETAALRVTLSAGACDDCNEVTVYGTADGVRNDPQIGRTIESSEIEKLPILGRKFSSIPLLNSAFRQGKGTGDLFVNQTYFITGVGSRRATTFTVDGASNDEGWGRQVGVATLPMAAVEEVNVMTNSFSAEFGWTSGPAINVITKSGNNDLHGEALVLYRPGAGWQGKRFSTEGFCPSSVRSTCVPPTSLTSILPVDIPDKLAQFSASIGGPIVKDRTFFFLAAERTHQDRTTFLSSTLPSFLLPASGNREWDGHYRQSLANARLDHRLNQRNSLMWRFNFDQFYDDNPQDAVGGTNAPSVARRYSRQSWTTQVNYTSVITADLLNEFHFAFLNADPVTRWEAQALSTIYTRGTGNNAVPFTIGQSRQSNLFSRQVQFSDSLSWTRGDHYVRFGGSIIRHRSGGTGNEPGALTLGTFTFLTTNLARNQLPFDQLTLADVQNYQQPISFGVSSYDIPQWLISGFVQDKWRVRQGLTLDLGFRYDRQTLTDATKNLQPRLGFAWNPADDARTVIRGGYGMYYTQVRTNLVAGYLINGLDGIANYTATSGQTGFPTCLTGQCLPVNVNPQTLPASQIPARDITIVAGKRGYYVAQFARYGLDFNRFSGTYSDKLVNPRSRVFTIGAEREFFKGLFVGSDFVHQQVDDLERTVDLNAPTPFARTAQGQFRCPVGVNPPCTQAQAVTAANATRPILPANGGVRQVNALMNLGEADYNGLQTQISYRGNRRFHASLSYTISKATNTTEPDGNGVGSNESFITELGEQERGPSIVDQRHRAVVQFSYNFPWNFSAGTLMQFASARPFTATTGVDNNGDGIQNDRPVIDGVVISKSALRGRGTQDISVYVQSGIKLSERIGLNLRLEGFNIFNHANMLARGVTVYGNGSSANSDFGWFTNQFTDTTRTEAIPAFANIDPPRMFQLSARLSF